MAQTLSPRKAALAAAVQEHGGKIPDPQIAAMLGATENAVWRMRTALGIQPFKMHGDTEAKRAIVWKRYIVEGLPATVVGLEMGLTERQVRKIAHGAGWKRDPQVWRDNSAVASRRTAHKRSLTWDRKRALLKAEDGAVQIAPQGPQLSDAELIARALEAGRVTVIPTGHACGTTRWESALHTAYPAKALTTQAQRAKAAKARQIAARSMEAA